MVLICGPNFDFLQVRTYVSTADEVLIISACGPVLSTLLSLPCLPWKSGICAAEEAKQRILQHMPEPGYLDREDCCC